MNDDELDYELAIRGIYNLSNQRIKTSKLREFLNKEISGFASAPKSSSATSEPSNEIKICLDKYNKIIRSSEIAINVNNTFKLNKSYSRLHHLMARTERISPDSQDEVVSTSEILDCVYDAMHRIVGIINVNTKKSRNNDISILETPVQISQPVRTAKNSNTRSDSALAESSHHSTEVRLNSPAGARGIRNEPSLSARDSLCDISLLREDERVELFSGYEIRANLLSGVDKPVRELDTVAPRTSREYSINKPSANPIPNNFLIPKFDLLQIILVTEIKILMY